MVFATPTVGARFRATLRSAVKIVVAVLALVPAQADDPAIHLADGPRPPVLDTFDIPDDVLALAVAPDGRQAALAVLTDPHPREPRSEIRLHRMDGGDPRVFEMSAVVRDLLYLDAPLGLYAIEHQPAKRHEGSAFLLRLGPEDDKPHRGTRLAPSARALDYWAEAGSLLVASRNEIRTVTVPGLRSGPLFRVPGENYAVAAIGGARILVGQEDALLLVDLSDPQTREGMPVRERVFSWSPIVALAVSADATGAVARLADRRVLEVRFDPLTLVEPTLEPDPTPPALPLAEPESAPPFAPPPAAEDDPAPEPEEDEAPVEAAPAEPVRETEPAGEAGPLQVRGRIDGPAADRVVAVVLRGPNNLLREAARVRPGPDGSWGVAGLEPGRYAVQLDGGGGSVLVVEPPTRTVEIGDSAVTGADFKVLRAH